MDWKLEVVVVPVSDVDRAKAFYADQVGFVVDVDQQFSDAFRVVQLTPRGSGCSGGPGPKISRPAPCLRSVLRGRERTQRRPFSGQMRRDRSSPARRTHAP